MKKFAVVLMVMMLTVSLFANGQTENMAEIKNVIVLIPDGMSVAGTTLARFYKGDALAMDPMASGLVNTWSSDGTIADSAPAGSAFATGWKSQSGNIANTGKVYSIAGARTPLVEGVNRPVATILEAAKLEGKATGIISTSEFMHATPADFASHDASRKNYDNLSEQIVYNNLDVILGGGIPFLTAEGRNDGEVLGSILSERGYTQVKNTKELLSFNGTKLIGVFGPTDASTAMSYDLDRDAVREPSISEMTAKAIEVLSKDEDGFFLMVEGSKVDWAAHANDPVGIITDILAFDDAVAEAVTFAEADGQTLVIAVTDHGNSGISIGNRTISSGYDKTPWTTFINPLKAAKVTGEGFAKKLPADREGATVASMGAEIRSLAAEWLGLTDLSDEEVQKIIDSADRSMNYTVGPMIADRALIGFTTNGHTGEDVVLYTYDPRGKLLTGYIDNTDVALFIADSINVNLDEATNALFRDAEVSFKAAGATVSTDASDAENPILIVKKGSTVLEIPRNKSVAYLNGKEIDSDGVAVYTGTQWFVAQNLIDLLK